ncbi:MAG: polysaccharide biosynthesis C-terminal domain-containing protein [Candidatus Cloacimonadales bacterium]|nr:polysaccharide biosynthesis C-terminal domain-containing protein [Candidatus Cloacimonadales bacterium]
MLNKIKHIFKHSTVYSIGNVAQKFSGIFLLPLYSKYITISEYGILGILEITIILLSQILIFGQAQAFLRFYVLKEFYERRKSTLFTVYIFMLFVGIILNLIGQYLAPKVSNVLFESPDFLIYIRFCIIIISLQLINSLLLSVLRAKEKSSFYTIANIVKVLIFLFSNIYLVAYLRIGIKGILISYLISDAVLFLIIFPYMISEMELKFDLKILKQLLAFGFPLIFINLAGMLLNVGDRYILKLLVDYREVGLYNLGYKIAGLLNVFFIQSFSLALFPLAFKMYNQKGDKRYYSKILTYFCYILFWAGLGLAFFGKEFIKVLTLNPDYWASYQVVPYIIFAYIISGAKYVVSLGLFLTKKTQYIAYNAIIAVMINIGLNFILIPKYKMIGAAIATVISFIILYMLTYLIANRYYKIPYENTKLIKMMILSIFLYMISSLFANMNLEIRVLGKLILFISFPIFLYFLNFYEKIEILRIKQVWNKWKNPLKWRGNLSKK